MDQTYAKKLLKETQQLYNKIAFHFDQKRAFLSEDIKKLGDLAKEGEKILDLGCGNGRLFSVFQGKRVSYFGVDFSERLIQIAQKKFPEGKFIVADAFNLPFENDFFDKVYSLAVFHHIPSKELRIKFLEEIFRILKPRGLLILSVWDLWKRKKIILKFFFLKIFRKTKLDFFDIFLPWKNDKGEVLGQRYFHCFSKKELKNLLERTGFHLIKIWKEGEGNRTNIFVLAQKPLTKEK